MVIVGQAENDTCDKSPNDGCAMPLQEASVACYFVKVDETRYVGAAESSVLIMLMTPDI